MGATNMEERFYELIAKYKMMLVFITKKKPQQKDFERGLQQLSKYERELYKILKEEQL